MAIRVNYPDESGLASARLLIQQQNYDAARAELKSVLAANPTDQEAIDLLMQVEQEAFASRHTPKRSQSTNWPDLILPMGPWWMILITWPIALFHIIRRLTRRDAA